MVIRWERESGDEIERSESGEWRGEKLERRSEGEARHGTHEIERKKYIYIYFFFFEKEKERN